MSKAMSQSILLGVCFVTCLTMASKRAHLQTEKAPPLKSETILHNRISQTVGADFIARPSDSDELFMTRLSLPVRVARKQARQQVKQAKEVSRDASRAQELVTPDDIQGSINLLPYERIRGKGVRFRYSMIDQEKIGYFWFVKPRDLRGRTIRISYSGIVPREMSFKLSRSATSAALIRRFLLEDSRETKTLTLEVPNTLPFRDVSRFDFEMERSKAGRSYGDFLIEKVEILDPANPWGGEVPV